MSETNLTPKDAGVELRAFLRVDIADRAIEWRRVKREMQSSLKDRFDFLEASWIEAERRLDCAIDQLDLLDLHTAQLSKE